MDLEDGKNFNVRSMSLSPFKCMFKPQEYMKFPFPTPGKCVS